MHGYGISRRIKECFADVLDVEQGSVISRIEPDAAKGLAEGRVGISDTNRKARFYRLTNAGQKQLASEATEFNKLVAAIRMVMKTA